MPKPFSKEIIKSGKNYAHKLFHQKNKMRALCSQLVFSCFFLDLYGESPFWTFINVQNRFATNKSRIIHFFHNIYLWKGNMNGFERAQHSMGLKGQRSFAKPPFTSEATL